MEPSRRESLMDVNEKKGSAILFALGIIFVPIGLTLWFPFLMGAPAYNSYLSLQSGTGSFLYSVSFFFLISAWYLNTDRKTIVPLEFAILGGVFIVGGLLSENIFQTLIGSACGQLMGLAGVGFIMGSIFTAGFHRRRHHFLLS
jgi:hypothetical protein